MHYRIIVENVKNIFGIHYNNESQRFILLLLIFLLLRSENGNGQPYDEYHHLISTAEEYYFLQNEVDSSLYYYQKCFDSYDFIFARDAINAFQIAFKEAKPIEYFLKIAMESGVTPLIISSIPALSEFTKDSLPNLDLMLDYDLYRSRYLSRINIKCLNGIYELGIIDQISKYKKGKHQTESLFNLASAFGLPGEKNCGVEELGINKELGSGAADFICLRDSMSKKSGRDLGYYNLNNPLIMHLPLVIMLHNHCTYKYYEQALHDAYLKGFIHPREIGCIYDNAFRDKESKCLMVPNRGIFGLNSFNNSTNINANKANRLRAKWEICSIETDRKKKELKKLGFKFIWDYW
jgi:hypothetical protein